MSATTDEPRSTDATEPTDLGPEVAASLTRTLAVLGSSSIAVGGIVALTSSGATARAFGQQTAAWGAINVAIAGFGAWRSQARPARAAGLRRTLLINAGLDVGYVAAGAHMAHHRGTFGGRMTPDAARGHGLAVVVQGLGLLSLDLTYARRLG